MTHKEGSKVARGATALALALLMIVSMLAAVASAWVGPGSEDESNGMTAPEGDDGVVAQPPSEDGTEAVAVLEEDDGLVIPPPSEDKASRVPVTETKVIDADQDGAADGGSWVFELHIRVDRDGDGNFEYAMDLVIVWSWWDPDEDGVAEVRKWSVMFREALDPNDDGIREVARGIGWEREVVDKDSDGDPESVKVDRRSRLVVDVRTAVAVDDAAPQRPGIAGIPDAPVAQQARWRQWAGDGTPELVRAKHVHREVVDRDSDGSPEYVTKLHAGRTVIDRDSDGNAECRRAHRDVVELFDRDDDGRWDAAHVTRAGYVVIDRDDDGTPDFEHKWSYDDWYYRRIPDDVARSADEDAEVDEGASEAPPLETLGL